ncbi:MAG: integrase [Candidatus Methanomethylicaceae archaeon]
MPEDVYRTLLELKRMYGTSWREIIINMSKNKEEIVRRVSGPPEKRSTSLPLTDLEGFRTWLGEHRKVSDETSLRYIQKLQSCGTLLDPRHVMTKYDRWLYSAARLFVRYKYLLGELDPYDRDRWFELLRFQDRYAMGEYPVSEEDVLALLSVDGPLKPFLEALYFSGVRIADLVHILANIENMKRLDFGEFFRLEVNYTRGRKRCFFAWFPSFIKLKPVALDLSHLARRLPRNPKILRKHFYRAAKRVALENRQDPVLADVYQSRISAVTVGDLRYGDLLTKADALYPKVVENLKAIYDRAGLKVLG